MLTMRIRRISLAVSAVLAIAALGAMRGQAQAALLVEEPYGFFGALSPTGHNAVYFARICAETPTRLRRCEPDEVGSVVARYEGISGYDWVAIPLIPYLYSVEDATQIPEHVDRATVDRLRDRYHEAHLMALGETLRPGSLLHGGWTELVGVAYERRTYAFHFDTTETEDDALIAHMNAGPNRSHFNFLYNNCSDFARVLLNAYFPRTFRRSIFPDAGMTTPKQVAWKLERYARKHPEIHFGIYEVPQVPGYRHKSRANKSVAEALATTVYAVPIALLNPYVATGIALDYLVRGRHRLVGRDVPVLASKDLSALTGPAYAAQTPVSAGFQAPGAAASDVQESQVDEAAYSGQKETKATHE